MKKSNWLLCISLFSLAVVGCKNDKGNSKNGNNNGADNTTAHQHIWGSPTYTWSDDNLSCVATRICELDSTHVETETSTSSYQIVTSATESSDGLGKYTATFENSAFSTQTKDVVIDKSSVRYVVTWQNYDGKVLEVDTDVLPGAIPTYDSNTPTRDEDEKYIYTFNGWDKERLPVHFDITFTAQYSLSNTVIWKNWNGDVLETDYKVENGSTPSFDDNTPVRDGGESKVYIFKGWSPAIANVTSDQEYTANFDEYDVTFDKLDLRYREATDTYTAFPLNLEIEGRVVIPGSYQGKPVTIYGFRNCVNITEVVISNKAVFRNPSFYDTGFSFCTNLETVIFEAGSAIQSIPNCGFCGCTKLVSINIPDSVTEIDNAAFRECFSLEEIILPSSLEKLESYAFYESTALEGIILPESLTYIGDDCFSRCTFESISIGNNVSYIGESAFEKCESLESVRLPEGLEKINNSVFRKCTSLTDITIPNTVTTIGALSFEGCTSLSHINLPEGLLNIQTSAFGNCLNLENIVIPTSIKIIGAGAFDNCPLITSVLIPDTIESIYFDSFDCDYITYHATYEIGKYLGDGNNDYLALVNLSSTYNETLNVHDNCKIIASRIALQTGLLAVNLNDGLEIIDEQAFTQTAITSVMIPSSVKKVAYGAFSSNYKLTSVTFASNSELVELGMFALSSNTKLTNIELPNTLTNLSDWTFTGDSGLTSVTLPSELQSIGKYAFYNCTSLPSITIPGTVKTIGERAFCYCDALSYIQFEGTIEEWNSITKGESWYYSSTDATSVVHCSDGNVEIVI